MELIRDEDRKAYEEKCKLTYEWFISAFEKKADTYDGILRSLVREMGYAKGMSTQIVQDQAFVKHLIENADLLCKISTWIENYFELETGCVQIKFFKKFEQGIEEEEFECEDQEEELWFSITFNPPLCR